MNLMALYKLFFLSKLRKRRIETKLRLLAVKRSQIRTFMNADHASLRRRKKFDKRGRPQDHIWRKYEASNASHKALAEEDEKNMRQPLPEAPFLFSLRGQMGC